MIGAERFHCGGHVAGSSIAEVVVGDHALDPGDPVFDEVGGRPGQELRAGRAPFVGQDFGVGQSGVVVDEGVDVVVADPAAADLSLRPWARHPPPSGILPSYLTSMWTSSPGLSRS